MTLEPDPPEALPAGTPDGRSDGAWTAPLDPERRAALKEIHRLEPVRDAVFLLFVLPWASVLLLGHFLPVAPVRVLEWLVGGIAVHGLAILMHEGSHGSLFRRPALDRWAAFAFGAPALLSATAYRVTHLEHHRHLRTKRDPEEFTNFTDRPWVHTILFWLWAAVGGATYLVFVPLNGLVLGSRRDRLQILLDYSLLGALYAGLISLTGRYGFRSDLLHGLVLPWVVAVAFTNVRGWAEHAMTAGGGPLLLSRVVTSNGFVSLLMLGSNYHLVHHLYPAVPWYNLRKLYRLLEADIRKAGASVYGSYIRFLADAVRVGVHGVAAGDGSSAR